MDLSSVIVVVLVVFLDVKNRGKLVKNVGLKQCRSMGTKENLAVFTLNKTSHSDFILIQDFHGLDVNAKGFVRVKSNCDSSRMLDEKFAHGLRLGSCGGGTP